MAEITIEIHRFVLCRRVITAEVNTFLICVILGYQNGYSYILIWLI